MYKYILFTISCLTISLEGSSGKFFNVGPAPSINKQDKELDTGSPSVVLLSPKNPNIIFLGTNNGGVWKTTNFGKHWIPLSDHEQTLSISSLAADRNDASLKHLFAGTGLVSNGLVANSNLPNPQPRGGLRNGILFSQDGGKSWQSNLVGNKALTDKSIVALNVRNVIPNLSGTIFAATFEPQAFKLFEGYGLYRSLNGGLTFENQTLLDPVLSQKPGAATSFVTSQSNPGIMFTAQTTLKNGVTTFADTAAYKSLDGGASWQPIFTAADSQGLINDKFQTVLEVVSGPSNAIAVKVVQIEGAEITGFTDRCKGVFLSKDGGTTWVSLPMPKKNINPLGQGIINSHLAFDPKDANTLFLTGTFLGEGISAYILRPHTPAQSFSKTNNGTRCHPDSRFITFDVSGRMLVGSDGGISLRTKPFSQDGSWVSINGDISIWQGYGAAFDANSGRILAAGQDTGEALQKKRGGIVYNSLPIGGDGVNAVINDQGERSFFYSSAQELGGLNRMIDGKFSTITLLKLIPNPELHFASPFVLNKVDMSLIAIGGLNNVFLTKDRLKKTLKLTPVGPKVVDSLVIAYGTRDNVNALASSSAEGPFLFFSDDPLHKKLRPLHAYARAGGLEPSWIVFDGRTQDHMYVADTINLFQTTDRGKTFKDITDVLLQPATTLYRPTALEFLSNNGVEALFVGGVNIFGERSPLAVADCNEKGNLSGWRLFGGNTLPNSIVDLITYNNKSDTLVVSDFGRGNYLMYDVTSNFPTAESLWFGKANNDSTPDLDVLNNGIFDARPLEKFGRGTLKITGPVSYTGLTTVHEGVLQLTNKTSEILDSVVVEGGVLKGVGRVDGEVRMKSGSTLSPGNSIGAISLGSLLLEQGSTTAIEINPKTSSLVDVIGVAKLGGNVRVKQTKGKYPAQQTYEILRARGGVLGSYNSDVLGGLPGFNFFVVELPTSVLLRYGGIFTNNLTGNNLVLAQFFNEAAFGTPGSLLLSSLVGNTLNEALGAIDPVRVAHATFVEDNTLFALSDFLFSHFSPLHYSQVRRLLCCDPCAVPECQNLWTGGFVEYGSQDSYREVSPFSFDSEGIFVGYDLFATRNALAGISLGYAHSNLHEGRNWGTGDIDYFLFTPYGTLYCGNGFFELAATLAWNETRVRRHIFFPGFDERAKSRHDGFHVMPHVAIGYDGLFCPWGVLEPFVEFDWAYNHEKDFREHGSGAFDFAINCHDSSMLRTEAGARLYQNFSMPCEGTFTLREEVAYVDKQLFGVGDVRASLLNFTPTSGFSNRITLSTFRNSQHLVTLGISAMFKNACGYYGMLSFDTEQSSDYHSYDAEVKIGRSF